MSWNVTVVTVNTSTGDAHRDAAGVAQALAEIDRDVAAAQAAGNTQAAAALQVARRVVAGVTPQPGGPAQPGVRAGVDMSMGMGDRIGEEIATAAARGDFKINLGSDERNE